MRCVHLLYTWVLALAFVSAEAQSDLKLWYNRPARNWNEALPVGNGRLGAMVFGRAQEELIQLNEETLWSGGPVNTNPNPDAPKILPKIREALFKGDYAAAEKLAQQMQGPFTESYEPLGDLTIKHDFASPVQIEDYYRDLDLFTAVATTRFSVGGVTFTREIFISAPDQVLIVHLTASRKNALNFSARLSSPLVHTTAASAADFTMNGRAPSHTDPSYLQTMEIPVVYNDPQRCRGMRFQATLRAKASDGDIAADDEGLHVTNATDVTLILSAATSFNGFDKCPDSEGKDERAVVRDWLEKAAQADLTALRENHVKDYQQYFKRVALAINGGVIALPTDERLRRYAEGVSDPHLETMYYQYGRYLLISSSRPGGIPANLQGIWNNHVRPPWSSNFTTNINTEMNYWMAESANLSELHQPLLDLIRQLSVTGKETVKNFYGASGWTVHHNTDIWATTNPVSGSPMWANWPLGGAWLSQHVWEHFQFTGDKKFLAEFGYPLMKQAAAFCVDWLVEKDGYLVTAPSTSPENVFVTEDGYKGTVSVATTMDMSLIWDLFTNVAQASMHLGIDDDYRALILSKRDKLYPLRIGKRGNLQEWFKDWDDADPEHRHISHLFGLFPGRQISPLRTPELAAAVRRSMDLRGDGGTGWSKGWKINIWARLHDGERAYKLIREQLKLTGVEGTDYANGGGTYPNLLDAHPPFQIDGNFGATSGMTEMLLQSHDGSVQLLPALPRAWSEGHVKGLRARGGFTIDISWKDHRITHVQIVSSLGGKCRILTRDRLAGKNLKKAANRNSNPFYALISSAESSAEGLYYDLDTEPGKTYVLTGK